MFKKKKIKPAKTEQTSWNTMTIPKDKDANKRQRFLRYTQAEDGSRVFVEKLRNYDLYVVSNGTNPGDVKVTHFAKNLKSALILANNKIAEIRDGLKMPPAETTNALTPEQLAEQLAEPTE